MTDAMLPHDDLAAALEACLALPDAPELIDPQWLLRAHELLNTLKTPPISLGCQSLAIIIGKVLCASRRCLIAGGSPATGYLSCFAKKGNPKKATPIHRPFGVPCVARQAGLLRNSRYALKQSSQTTPDLAALLGGESRGIQTKHPIPILAFPLKGKEPLPPLPSEERAGVRGRK